MKITIAERLRPFTHIPGNVFILPGSTLRVQVFPALLRIHDISQPSHPLVADVSLDIQGPLNDFIAMQDLESGTIFVWGNSPKGFVRYSIVSVDCAGLTYCSIQIEKASLEGIQFRVSSDRALFLHGGSEVDACSVFQNETILLVKRGEEIGSTLPRELPNFERLSLGNHKSQDWSLMQRRLDFSEIFPLWDRLAQWSSKTKTTPASGGVFDLLNQCREVLDLKSKEKILPAFQRLFLAGFSIGLCPRLEDSDHHGFHLSPANPQGSALQLLTEGRELIRRLFINQQGDQLSVLPLLPAEFHSGRFVNVDCGEYGTLDMEWSKKLIRRLIFTAYCNATIHPSFSKEIKRYRLRQGLNEKGLFQQNDSPLRIEKGVKYFFDCFEK